MMAKLDHQEHKRTRPIMMTTTPIMIPSIFDTILTPFIDSVEKKLAKDEGEVKANFNRHSAFQSKFTDEIWRDEKIDIFGEM
jgi:hypothetical protein